MQADINKICEIKQWIISKKGRVKTNDEPCHVTIRLVHLVPGHVDMTFFRKSLYGIIRVVKNQQIC